MNDNLKEVIAILRNKKVNIMQLMEKSKLQNYNVLVGEERELTGEEFALLKEYF